MSWWRRKKPAITIMLDEHLSKKRFDQRAKLREKHREQLEELEHIDLPKDAVIIKRKDIKGFAAGFIITFFLVGLIGSAYAVFYAGNQQIISTVSTGTSPFTVASTTKVDNLNADMVDGYDSSTFLPANCTPATLTGFTTSTTYQLIVTCTSCSGWLQGYRMAASGANEARMYVEIDGTNSSMFSSNDPVSGGTTDSGFYAIARYTSSLKVYLASSQAGVGARGLVSDCRE